MNMYIVSYSQVGKYLSWKFVVAFVISIYTSHLSFFFWINIISLNSNKIEKNTSLQSPFMLKDFLKSF